MKKLIVTIDKEGKMKIEADGFIGPACEEEVHGVLKAFGGEAESEEHKPEYYQERIEIKN